MTRLTLALLASSLLACGYYGPPQRERPPAPPQSDSTFAPPPGVNCLIPSGDCETPGR